jgi:FtsP/CotA-like multicopper oxidase with cupredoxin domain
MKAVAKDEIVRLGDLEVWEFENVAGNGMGMMGGMNLPHPMHIHGLQFQVIEREISADGQGAWQTLQQGFVDEGWHDTVLVMPGEKVKVLVKFENFTGLYLYHCHNLEHEDMGMMRNYRVEA